MNKIFYVIEDANTLVRVEIGLKNKSKSHLDFYSHPTNGPDYLFAKLDDSGNWFAEFESDDEEDTYFDNKEEAIGALITSMLKRCS